MAYHDSGYVAGVNLAGCSEKTRVWLQTTYPWHWSLDRDESKHPQPVEDSPLTEDGDLVSLSGTEGGK